MCIRDSHSACRAGILFQHCVCVCMVTTAILIDRLLVTSVNMHSDGPLCAKWSIHIRLLGTLARQKYGTAASMVLPTISSQKLWSQIMSAGCCHLHKNGYICACVDIWAYNAHVVNTKDWVEGTRWTGCRQVWRDRWLERVLRWRLKDRIDGDHLMTWRLDKWILIPFLEDFFLQTRG